MPPLLSLNYIILNAPKVDNVRTIEIDADQTIAKLIKALESEQSLSPGQIKKLARVSMSMDDEAIHEKLRNFSFNTPVGDLRASRKLSTLFTDPDPDDIHLIIRPPFIDVNYAFPDISPRCLCVRIPYDEDVKALLVAILTDLRSKGYHVPPNDYIVFKTSIGINADLATVEGQELLESLVLSDVFEQVPDREHVHILLKARSGEESRGIQVAVAPLESARRLRFLQDRRAEAPSSGGQPQVFSKKQESATQILCNRPSSSTPPVPLTLLDRAFAQFLDDCDNIPTTREINEFTLKLANEMSKFYSRESKRCVKLIDLFLQLGMDFKTFKIPETAYEIDVGLTKGQFLVVCGEIKNEDANSSDDPYLQAVLYYLEQTRPLAANFASSVLPCLILLCVGALLNISHIYLYLRSKGALGPYLSFAGAVWNGRPNIQVLTPAIPLHFHHTDLKLRTTTARYIAAFKSAVESLKDHYEQPYYQNPAGSIAVRVDGIFPYPKSFECGTSKSSKYFVYISQVKPNKLIFRAEVCDTHEKICVKFVQRYSPEAHRICAKIGCAPELLGFEALPGGWFMVVMKELDNHVDLYQSSLTPDRLDEVKHHLRGKLIEMHQQGFVHGDVRDVNVMVSNGPGPSLGVMLVDFDWAGRIGEVRYPMNVNREGVQRPEDAIDHELILTEHDLIMLEDLTML